MQTVTTIGLDIAKSVFQVHGVDVRGNVAIRRSLSDATRSPSSRSCRRRPLGIGRLRLPAPLGHAKLRRWPHCAPMLRHGPM